MTKKNEEERYDIFISYTSADRAWAEWIAWSLESTGHTVAIQAWDFMPGTEWVQRLDAAVASSACTLAVLSTDYLSSVYGRAEWRTAWSGAGGARRLATARVTDCDRPGPLGHAPGVDLFGVNEETARRGLTDLVAKELGRARDPGSAAVGSGRTFLRKTTFPVDLPPIRNGPAQNPVFVGRADELATLSRYLVDGVPVVIAGGGGFGKTALVNEYVYQHAHDYDLVWWIAADEPASVREQLAGLARRLGLPDPAADELPTAIKRALGGIRGWLLVFEDAGEPETIKPWLQSSGTPTAEHIIVTTERGGQVSYGEVIQLDVLDSDSAMQLLQSHLSRIDAVTARSITNQLGRLPLALVQAAAYLARTGTAAEAFRARLERGADSTKSSRDVLSAPIAFGNGRDIHLPRAETYDVAADVMNLCAFLAPQPIPFDLFTAYPEALPERLASAARNPRAFYDAIAPLVDFSVAQRTPRGLAFHRLVLESVRARHSEPAVPVRWALHLLRAAIPSPTEELQPEGLERWELLLPHVLVATRFAEILSVDDSAAADLWWLLDRTAAFLRHRGQSKYARPLLEKALSGEEASRGSEHTVIARRLTLLAGILGDLGLHREGWPLLARATEIDERVLGAIHPVVATDLRSVADALANLGRPHDARPHAERALRIAEQVYGRDHPETARTLRNLADIAYLTDGAETCRRLVSRSLLIDEAAYGSHHPIVFASLIRLADVLQDLGEFESALPLARRALSIAESGYGWAHPEVGNALNNVGLILHDLGRLDEAAVLLRRGVDVAEDVYGSTHPAVAVALNNLASALLEQGNTAEARPLLERALRISETAEPNDRKTIAYRLRSLGRLFVEMGNQAKAESLRKQADDYSR